MIATRFFLGLMVVLTGWCWAADEPAALVELRKNWTVAKAKAVEPVNQKYIEALKNMKAHLMRGGDLEGALAVDAELKAVGAAAEEKSEVAGAKGKIVRISAKDKDGYRIGVLAAGQEIAVQYVSGKWRGGPGAWPEESPDTAVVPQNSLVLVTRQKKEQSIVATIKNTEKAAFTHKVVTEGDYYLVIRDDLVSDNDGVVEYRVNVSN